MRNFQLAMIILICLFSSPLFALTFTQTGAIIEAVYDEPTTNKDGSALTDLDHCTLYYNLNDATGDKKGKDVPASSVSGGGKAIAASFEVPVIEGMERDVDFWGTCTDISQNESVRSVIIRKRIDRLPPDTVK